MSSGQSPTTVEIIAVPGIPEITDGVDLAWVIHDALTAAGLALRSGDIVVVASKVVSKAAGLRRHVPRDVAIAAETVRVVAERAAGDRITRVVQSAAGPVMAAAGVDESNIGADGGVLVLPRDPDAAAAALLTSLRRVSAVDGPLGVIITDTAGRPWRAGVVDFALGSAGVQVLDDHRQGVDADGRPLSVTVIAVADEIAAAADLVKGKAAARPVALVRGLPWARGGVGPRDAADAAGLVRTGPTDWFRTGPVEAIRAALGVPPGSPQSTDIGIPSVTAEPVAPRVERVRRLALHGAPADVTGTAHEAGLTLRASTAYSLGVGVTRAEIAAAAERLTARVEHTGDLSADLSFSEIHDGR
ncbi:MAG TPA: hypothetical protein GXZ60_01195 [Intrasporangiaceae bacterium]|nr:hypothetical protein [Intrasporangiaceae bacterium]